MSFTVGRVCVRAIVVKLSCSPYALPACAAVKARRLQEVLGIAEEWLPALRVGVKLGVLES